VPVSGFRSLRSFRKRTANRLGIAAQSRAEAAGNFRNSRNFRSRTTNRRGLGIPAQGRAAAAGMVDRDVADMT
jgi:hypothetical protein